MDAGAVQPVRADPHPHPGPEEPFAGPGRLCGGGHGVDRAVPVRGGALRPQRGCPPLCGCPVRDGLWPHHHRSHHPDGCGGHAKGDPLLAGADPVDGRHGCAGAVSGPDAPGGGGGRTPDAGRKPRPYQEQAAAPCQRHRQGALWHLHWSDDGGDRGSVSGGHGPL